MTQRCYNCDLEAEGTFCPGCGQRLGEPSRRLAGLLAEAAEEFFSVDGRGLRTLKVLITRPGQLTTEWMQGHRARYASPLKVYAGASLLLLASTFIFGIGPFAWGGQEMVRQADALRALNPNPFLDSRFAAADASLRSVLWDTLTLLIFGLVPAWALVSRVVMLTSRRYLLADHLVFALHSAAAAMIIWAVAWPFLGPVFVSKLGVVNVTAFVALGVTGVYLGFAFRRVYELPLLRAAGAFGACLIFGLYFPFMSTGSWVPVRILAARQVAEGAYRDMAEDAYTMVMRMYPQRDRPDLADFYASRMDWARQVHASIAAWDSTDIHLAADRAQLALLDGDPAGALEAVRVPIERETQRAEVLAGFAARASAELGRTADATELYRAFLTQTDADFFREGFHHGVATEYQSRARAWLTSTN